jgi:Phospholipase_D-nuclease N-terminal
MARLYAVLTFVDIAFMIFAFVDVLLTQDWRVRGVPKIVWLVIVLLLSPIGGILWFFVGKEPIDGPVKAPRRREVAPDDDPEFLARMRAKDDQDERIRKLEQELAELDDDQTDPGDPKNDTKNS